jgi:hypothetical protein
MDILSDIDHIETIASRRGIREYALLVQHYGGRNWLKKKGVAKVSFNGRVGLAEVHWYECHGVGRVKMKLKHWM